MSDLPPQRSWFGEWGNNKSYSSKGNWATDKKPSGKGGCLLLVLVPLSLLMFIALYQVFRGEDSMGWAEAMVYIVGIVILGMVAIAYLGRNKKN